MFARWPASCTWSGWAESSPRPSPSGPAGNPTPRTVETPSGLLNAIGLDNDGIAHFREHHLPYLRTVGTAVIANIAGEDEDQFVAMAELLGQEPGLAAVDSTSPVPT